MNGTAMSLEGKRVVVIGGATGIGFAAAELAQEQGASVVIGSSNKANVSTAVERLQGATGCTVDLSDEANVIDFFKEVGAFDHLAITAGDWGGPMFASLQDLDLTQARELFTVRFWGALSAAKHCGGTIAQDGSITLTSGHDWASTHKGHPRGGRVKWSGGTPYRWSGNRSRSGAGQRRLSGLRHHRTTEADA